MGVFGELLGKISTRSKFESGRSLRPPVKVACARTFGESLRRSVTNRAGSLRRPGQAGVLA